MQIAFIRHAEAAEATEFQGLDIDRPLTSKGWKTARKAFSRLPRLLEEPVLLVHSQARRARETAEAVAEVYPRAKRVETALLNPGASTTAIRRCLQSHARRKGCVVLVGHEPDFSQAIEDLTGARCRLRKAAVAVVSQTDTYRLDCLLGPELLQAMKKPD